MTLASLDGVIAPADQTLIPVSDEGLIRGDGIFEVVRLYDGKPFKLAEHMARLVRSGEAIRIPVDVESVQSDMWRLLAESAPFSDAVNGQLRIMLTRGGRRILFCEPLHTLPQLARVATVQYQPTLVLDGVKSLSYAANMLASRVAIERGFDEALLVTPSGLVLEAPTKSVFWVAGGAIYTPPLSDHILASITRAMILDVVPGIVERSVQLEELLGADEIFLASTTREVQTVVAVDDAAFAADGPVTAQVRKAVGAYLDAWRAGSGA